MTGLSPFPSLAASIAGAALVLVAVPALAEPTASGEARAAVVAPIAVTREADLDFGTLTASPDRPGTVSVAALTGALRYAGGVTAICAAACPPPHPARFAVTGEPGRSYVVTVPGALSATPVGGGPAVRVDRLAVATVSDPRSAHGVLSHGGTDSFEVGGTLHVPANAAAGRYTTQVPVMLDYM